MLEIFLKEIVDYAGLFPPAGLDMTAATQNFERYRNSPERWMLGRFVVAANRLSQFRETATTLAAARDPWPVSVLVPAPTDDGPFCQTIDELEKFNRDNTAFCIDSIETRIDSLAAAKSVGNLMPKQFRTFWETVVDQDLDGRLKWIKSLGNSHAAKIRTGGVEASMIPKPEIVAEFLNKCVENDVPFKATAGLHHPIRADYRLTYEANAPCATMFGFLNVFIAAIVARAHRISQSKISEILACTRSADFVCNEKQIGWQSFLVAREEVEKIRNEFAVSFGSCSFEEPVNELRQMGWLPALQLR